MAILLPPSGLVTRWSGAAPMRARLFSQLRIRKAEYQMSISQKNLPGDQPEGAPILFYILIGVTGFSIVAAIGYAFFS